MTQRATDKAAPLLREVAKCLALGLVDANGELLSWDGSANEHYDDICHLAVGVVTSGYVTHATHDHLPCQTRGRCAVRSVVIVPLTVEGQVEGALIMLGRADLVRLRSTADAIAQFLCDRMTFRQLDAVRMRLATAEAKALLAQISPHFLYNALNTILGLIATNPERARELLLDLAEFTRETFRSSGMFTTLAEEVINVCRYLALEVARYGHDRLKVHVNVAPEVLQTRVPFLSLQPLVENAVRHGIAKKVGGGTLTLLAQDRGSEVLVSIEDDGVGMDAGRLLEGIAKGGSIPGAHVGIANINNRICMLYGNQYALIFDTAPGAGTKVTARFPKFARAAHGGVIVS
ncbi:sensor histidine kinase [Labedaea rhizosphaerae]|uniref:Two-component system LytT family sensor kinase n=1 Tax=Labedaea rhizosphaerae TaxID=598644 RepID=A0A4V3CZ49_LABRH|nr:histidine kinase [Labedaea rhizosphaerae]TDP96618.1 two-component system LytT family sensor kinase [Labedaea rhizosphaerae]